MDLAIRGRRFRLSKAAQHILAHNACPNTLEKDGIDYLKTI